LIAPLLLPQVAGVITALSTIKEGSLMFTVSFVEQPLKSVTVTIYVPTHNPVAVAVA